MGLITEYEIYNFRYGSILIRGAIYIEDRDGFRKLEETEPRTFGVVSVYKVSGGTAVY
jgi:hypothetical protein